MFHIIRLDTYDYNPLSKIKEKYCNEEQQKKKNHPVNIFMYIVLNILTLTAEEWNFRDRGMAQRTKRGSRLVPL